MPFGEEGFNDTFSRDSEEIWNSKKRNSEPLIHSQDWGIMDFLLYLAGLLVVVVCLMFCYFLGVFEACKRRSSGRIGDDEYDRRTIRGKGLAGCVGCID